MRSAVSSRRVGAVTRATSVPGDHAVAVGDEVVERRTPPSPHTASITAAATGEPGDDAVAAGAERPDAALGGRHGGDGRDVDAAHRGPRRRAMRTSAATASGSSPPAISRSRVAAGERVEHEHADA